MLKHLLLFRFIIFNTLMSGMMAWFISKGWLGLVLAADPTGISLSIMVLFSLTFLSTVRQLWKIGKDKDAAKNNNVINEPPLYKRILKRSIKLRSIKLSAETMTVLGIIGTVVGFIVAFTIQDASMLASIDVGSMPGVIFGMIKGMSIALYTTLTGAIFGLWTTWNHAMIKDAVDILKVDRDVR